MPTTSRRAAVQCSRAARRRLVVSIVALTVLAVTTPAQGQKGKLTGIVRDSTGAPVPEADVSIASAHLLTRTNSTGAFVLSRVDAGQAELSVRRLGFYPLIVQLDVKPNANDTLIVVMAAQALELAGVEITEQTRHRLLEIEDFYRRRAKGIGGTFFTREDIEARHASRLSDVLREAPGVRFVRARGGGSGIRFDSPANFRRDCVPQYFIDGQRVTNVEIDDLSARDVEGVELYAGPASTPTQFQQSAVTSCGTVVIWTRVPGT